MNRLIWRPTDLGWGPLANDRTGRDPENPLISARIFKANGVPAETPWKWVLNEVKGISGGIEASPEAARGAVERAYEAWLERLKASEC